MEFFDRQLHDSIPADLYHVPSCHAQREIQGLLPEASTDEVQSRRPLCQRRADATLREVELELV